MYKVYAHITPNGKTYIGITKADKPENRWGLNGTGYRLQQLFWRAIQKYGWDNIQHIIILNNLSKAVAIECEKYLISKFKTNDAEFGYNLTTGGEGVSGYVYTEEQCKRRSERMKGHTTSEETRKKIGQANSIALKGKTIPLEVRKKLSEANKGKKHPHTLEQDRLQSERLKGNKLHLGYKASEESKKRMSEAHKGYKRNPEAIQKTIEGRRKYYEEHPEKELERREKLRKFYADKRKAKMSNK